MRWIPFALLGLVASSAPAEEYSSFQVLEGLPGAAPFGVARAISGDGSTIVGWSRDAYRGYGVRWRDGVVEKLTDADGFSADAEAVSTDGEIVTGDGYRTSSPGDAAYRWDGTAWELLVAPYPGETRAANAVSADGSVVVGDMHRNNDRAFRWEAGVAVDLGLGGGRANDVSADGSVIVGRMNWGGDVWGYRLEAGSYSLMGDLPGGSVWSTALAVTPDGSTLVGRASSAAGWEAFHWADGVTTNIGDLPGGAVDSHPYDVAPNGTVVGAGSTDAGFEAWVWTAADGLRPLRDALISEFGVAVPPGFSLTYASGISDDGRIVVGTGTDPSGAVRAWRSTLVVPECRNGLDDDADGYVDAADDGCTGALDHSEADDCSNGRDDDGDGRVDYPDDPGCLDPFDGRERESDLPCDDGLDNDGDGWSDFPDDIVCLSPAWPGEVTACNNGIDDDGDGWIDLEDVGCEDATTLGEEFGTDPLEILDLATPGDALLIRDRAEGVDWLSLLPTIGLSVQEVQSGAGGFVQEGWRHATWGELVRLTARQQPLYPVGFGWSVPEDVFGPLRAAFGTTYAAESYVESVGHYVDPVEGQGVFHYRYIPDFPQSDAFGGGTWPATPAAGHFLVRALPPSCSNGVDDDADGQVDALDPGCSGDLDPTERADCADGLDNDGDGRIDFPADRGCRDATGGREDPACDDRLDNDGDGLLDAPADPGCQGLRWRNRESPRGRCGLGGELVLLAPLSALFRPKRRRLSFRRPR